MSDLDILTSLLQRGADSATTIVKNDAYYDGALRLEALGLSLPPEMRALQTVVNWPRLCVDSLEERLDLEGFRMRGSAEADDRVWGWWQANNLDEEAPQVHLEALVQGHGFVTVGLNEEDETTPLITVESAASMVVDLNSRTRRPDAAVRPYDADESGQPQAATLYLPDKNVYYKRGAMGGWLQDDVHDHQLGLVTVEPMVNRSRIRDRSGRSEMADVIPITDAACRSLTNLQGAQEFMAVPTRYVFGATKDDFVDREGNAIPTWQAYIGRLNAISAADGDVKQLPAADLRNFTETLNMYARLVSSLSGLPPHFLGLTNDNPASADAIRSAEARLVKRAERRCQAFGGTWEKVMRLGMLIVDGKVPEEANRMEAIWRDPATPTYAARVDAVCKLVASGILTPEAAWEELGWSSEKRKHYRELSSDDPLTRLVASMGVEQPVEEEPAA